MGTHVFKHTNHQSGREEKKGVTLNIGVDKLELKLHQEAKRSFNEFKNFSGSISAHTITLRIKITRVAFLFFFFKTRSSPTGASPAAFVHLVGTAKKSLTRNMDTVSAGVGGEGESGSQNTEISHRDTDTICRGKGEKC